MNEKEHSELNAWIAEHVMGWRRVKRISDIELGTFAIAPGNGVSAEVFTHLRLNHVHCFHPTTDPAAAFEVLQKCIEEQHRLGAGDFGFISKDGNNFWIRTVINGRHVEGDAPTLALCIAKFAKQLFSKLDYE